MTGEPHDPFRTVSAPGPAGGQQWNAHRERPWREYVVTPLLLQPLYGLSDDPSSDRLSYLEQVLSQGITEKECSMKTEHLYFGLTPRLLRLVPVLGARCWSDLDIYFLCIVLAWGIIGCENILRSIGTFSLPHFVLMAEQNEVDPIIYRLCEIPCILQLHKRIILHERVVMEEQYLDRTRVTGCRRDGCSMQPTEMLRYHHRQNRNNSLFRG